MCQSAGPFSTARRALCRAAVTLALHRRREDVSVSLPGLFPIPYSLFRGASPRNSLVFFLLPIFSSLSVPLSHFSLSLSLSLSMFMIVHCHSVGSCGLTRVRLSLLTTCKVRPKQKKWGKEIGKRIFPPRFFVFPYFCFPFRLSFLLCFVVFGVRFCRSDWLYETL